MSETNEIKCFQCRRTARVLISAVCNICVQLMQPIACAHCIPSAVSSSCCTCGYPLCAYHEVKFHGRSFCHPTSYSDCSRGMITHLAEILDRGKTLGSPCCPHRDGDNCEFCQTWLIARDASE